MKPQVEKWGKRIFVTVLVAAFSACGAARTEAAEKIVFDLGWIPYGMHAGLFLAKAKGYYRAQGISADIVRGYGGRTTAKKLASGTATFGLGGISSVIVARTKGAPIRAIGVYHDQGPEAIFTLDGSGIRKPKDLEGRIIGAPIFSSPKLLFTALARVNGIQRDRVNWKTMTPPAQLPSLLAGQVDAIVTYTNIRPNLEGKIIAAGKRLVVIRYSDYGVDIYSNGIETTDKIIRENPGLVKGFLKAIVRGTVEAIENPGEGIKALLKDYPSLDPKITRGQWEITVDHMLTPTAKKLGLFHITLEKMERTRDLIVEVMRLGKKLPVNDFYTNEFLPKAFPKRSR